MARNGSKLRPKQEEAILALLTNRSVEDAARAVKIGRRTLYRWLSEPEFDQAYRKARRTAFGQGTARLQQSSNAAVSTVLKVMVDQGTPASTKLRAADLVLTHAAKAIEDIEARVAELERAAEAATPGRTK
ncbi:MAG: phBC6A51 family helix-turn-helix protein [Terriglobia bacterium]